MNRTRILGVVAAIAAAGIAVAGCTSSGNSSGQQLEQNTSNNIEKTFLLNQPPPTFAHSDIRAAAISIEAIQALGEQTTSFGLSNDGKLIWECPSLGEPVASTTEITNPVQGQNLTDGNGNYNTIPVGNMDPNGIYAGNSTGTYVLCVDSQGRPYTQYWEGYVDTVSGPAQWIGGRVVMNGAPTMPRCTYTAASGGRRAKTVCTK
jgi:hypothetical protein